MTNHLPTSAEVVTADEADAAARAHRRAAGAVARREAAARGDLPPIAGRITAPKDPATHRGAAPQQAGNKRTWQAHHSAADDLVARANTLREQEQAAMATNQDQSIEIEELRLHVQQLQDQARVRANAERANAGYNLPARTLSVGRNETTYNPDDLQQGRASYLQDVVRFQLQHDPSAGERLARHAREMATDGQLVRDIGSGAVGAFVPPSYAVELFAPLARAGRPLADLCTVVPLPSSGMTVSIPRVTTGTSAAAQTAESASVSETDFDETTLDVAVRTVAGQQDISFQALARGQYVESVIWADLGRAYAAALDSQAISGTGLNGQHLGLLNVSGINAVTYTDASPTLVAAWPKLADAAGRVVSTSYRGPTAIVVHPTTWAWMLAELDTTDRPLIAPTTTGPSNSMGVTGAPTYGPVGNMLGLPVILDGNLPTNLGVGGNQTPIVVAAFDEHFLMEEGTFQIRADQPGAGNLMSKLVLYGFSAFTAGRVPAATSVVLGTGCIVPAL